MLNTSSIAIFQDANLKPVQKREQPVTAPAVISTEAVGMDQAS